LERPLRASAQEEDTMDIKKKKNASKSNRNNTTSQPGSIAYRLKCAKTANGLSHFVMYGDVRKDKALL
jgi:hypothetical protein